MLTSISSWPELNTGSSNSGSFGGFGTFAMAPTVNGGTEEDAPSARPLRRMSVRPPSNKPTTRAAAATPISSMLAEGGGLSDPSETTS